MRCPSCGAENPASAKACSECGKAFAQHNARMESYAKSSDEIGKSDDMKQLAKALQEICTPLIKDPNERVMDQIEKLMLKGTDPKETIDSFLLHAGTLIYRLFGISEVAIALKDPSENRFRYRLFFGMRKESEDAYRKISYTLEQTTSTTEYPRIRLSEYVDFFPSEYRPYIEGELDTFNRPSKLEMKRKSPTEMIEGDYFCVYFYGLTKNDILGWFELARTLNGKMPPRETLKWLEMLASIVGRIVHERRLSTRQTSMLR
ncbi:MAG: zinc ribbon domain-containing protein [Thermoplasmata archaeon]